jgi:membrane fusion protein (multidrug efflux system)
LLRLQSAIKAGRMKKTASADIGLLLEDGSIYPHAGTILFSDLAVDESTGAVSVRARVPNPRHELLPGMFVRVRFPAAVAEQAIRVPQRAVHAGPQGQFVLQVTADGKAAPLPVKTGNMVDGDFIISEGLKGGERIIVNGMARPGMPVKIVAPAATDKTGPSPVVAGKKED